MGSVEDNDFVPFQMYYIYDAAEKWGEEPWYAEPKRCNESYDVRIHK